MDADRGLSQAPQWQNGAQLEGDSPLARCQGTRDLSSAHLAEPYDAVGLGHADGATHDASYGERATGYSEVETRLFDAATHAAEGQCVRRCGRRAREPNGLPPPAPQGERSSPGEKWTTKPCSRVMQAHAACGVSIRHAPPHQVLFRHSNLASARSTAVAAMQHRCCGHDVSWGARPRTLDGSSNAGRIESLVHASGVARGGRRPLGFRD
jgi:hypothetical protein